jgi:hypothetical protein
MYYLKDNKELYAWTDKKSIAKRFESERLMSRFIKQVEHEDETCEDFYKDYPQEFLTEYPFKTLIDGVKVVAIPKVITGREKLDVINSSTMIWEVYLHTYEDIPRKIFSNEVYKALEILGYNTNFYTTLYKDELSTFIHLYGKLLKESEDLL